MITLYSGTPGSGKSLHLAETITYHLRKRKPVIGNFEIDYSQIKKKNKGEFIYLDNLELSPDKLIAYANQKRDENKGHPLKEGTILLCIDECQIIFNSRDWAQANRNSWLSFFTQHRKYGFDVILISQFDRMIDRQIRALIEYEYIHRKVVNAGIWGKIFSVMAFGKLFIYVKMWYPMKQRVGFEFFKAHKKYYELYDTYKTFSTSGQLRKGTQGAPADGGRSPAGL